VHIEEASDADGNRTLFCSTWNTHAYVDTVLKNEPITWDRIIELLHRASLVAYDAALTDEDWWRMKNDRVLADLNDLKEECFESPSSPKRHDA